MAKTNLKPDQSGTATPPEKLLTCLQEFAEAVTAKFSSLGDAEPEEQLRTPVEALLNAYAEIIGVKMVVRGEVHLKDRLGKPDFAVDIGHLPTGYVEVKAPGKGASPERYKGHDHDQWLRFKNVPNIIYTDGNEWALYRSGRIEGHCIRFKGDVCSQGSKAIELENARDLFQILAAFSSWSPIVPHKPKELAAFLAPYCRLIREDVADGVKADSSSLRNLRDEVKKLLFPDANDDQFADAYAQTVTFALLLARMEGADVLNLSGAYEALASHHLLLSRSLQFLTDPEALKEISSSVSLAQRVIQEIPPEILRAKSAEEDPWLFFYEYFLAQYDSKLRKAWGVYYTPVEVVRCQVGLVDEILSKELGKEMGFVEAGVLTLDPALGTGTYLLGIIEHALKRVTDEEGPGAVKGGARCLLQNLYGFEWMVGPYAVAQLRVSRALTSYGVALPPSGVGISLTNTLESPHTRPPAPPLFHKPIAQEHERALKVKDALQVLVCLGNPPYGRHESATASNKAVTGAWVRYGGDSDTPKGHEFGTPILEDFLKPVRDAGHGGDLKNLYNHYVYFVRWALWKVFEHKCATGPGIVSFITASSYLEGDAFAGVREHMRRECDHIDIIDLGGEGRGTRKDKNVFAIQTPVCIFVAWRKAKADRETPAAVRYTRIEGNRKQKLEALNAIKSSKNLDWLEVPNDWQSHFKPAQKGKYSKWPLLTDIIPWQNNGVKAGRIWVVDPTEDGLRAKLETLLKAPLDQQPSLFKNSPTGRKFGEAPRQLPPSQAALQSLAQEKEANTIRITRYSYRSFDRQFIIADSRFLDRHGPGLWQAHSDQQVYLTSLFSIPLDQGPALVCCSDIPDLDFFRGSYGAKAVLPLYRDSAAKEPNILPGLLPALTSAYGREVGSEDLVSYVYAILAQPEYTTLFAVELAGRKVRVLLTKNGKLFSKVAEFGKRLIWLHTYGERMTGRDRPHGSIPKGKAKCLKAVSEGEDNYPNEFAYDENAEVLCVGDGRFGPVQREVFEFEVSGFKVVKSWLGYRMRERSGKKSSPLDDIRPKTWTHQFTHELLELLWVLEHTIEGYPAQRRLLEDVLNGDLFTAEELPPVPDSARMAPKVKRQEQEGQCDWVANGEDENPN